MNAIQLIGLRLRQVREHTRPGSPVALPSHLDERLTPAVRAQFRLLTPSDQRHLMRVADLLERSGAGDDVVTAGLLHDIGKAAPGVTISIQARIAIAVLPTSMTTRIAELPAIRWLLPGLGTLIRHAETGAQLIENERYTPSISWLVRHHEDPPEGNRDLALLAEADDHAFDPLE